MAALQPAVDRIKYIITGEGKRIASPATISGTRRGSTMGGSINSYSKCIGVEGPDGHWGVDTRNDSLTTNRHVRSLIEALNQLGIEWSEMTPPEDEHERKEREARYKRPKEGRPERYWGWQTREYR